MDVEYTYIENIDDLDKLRASKYVQSCVEINYKHVKEFLEKGELVLFTETPCQIEGLKAYLSKDYDNLYCMNIIRHGVPSPLVWRRFLKEIYNVENIRDINFRNKTTGWGVIALKYNILIKL